MLVTISEAIESLGISPVLEDQMEAPLLKAISKAQLRLESELDSKLDQLDNVETFHVDSELNASTLIHGLLCLRLQNAFVVPVADPATPAIECADEWKGPYEVIPTTEYTVNMTKGLVYLDEAYDVKYIKVSYRSGFKKPGETPVQIKQALLSMLPATLNVQNDGDEEKKPDKSGLQFAGTIVSSLKRPATIAFRPYLFESTVV
jgi:hypothetical protein